MTGGFVDSADNAPQVERAMKKIRKAEEPAAAYSVSPKETPKSSPESGPRFADDEKVLKANAKIMRVHRKVLQKLAQ